MGTAHAISVLTALATWRPAWWDQVQAATVEWITLAYCVITNVAVIAIDYYRLAQFVGVDPHQAMDAGGQATYFSDSRILMTMVAALFLTHIVMPIRWLRLIIMEFGAILIYGLCIGLGSPEGGLAFFNMMFLMIIEWLLIIGSRGSELSQRSALVDVVRERTLRFQNDFLLSQVADPLEAKEVRQSEYASAGQSEYASAVSLCQSETLTATIFGSSSGPHKIEDPVFFDMMLQSLHQLAEDERWLVPCSSLELIPDAILGSGGFGVVVLGKLQGAAVAVEVSVAGTAASRFQSLMAELRVFRRLRHQNIVHFHGACVDVKRQEVALVEELVEGPTLSALVRDANANDSSLPKEVLRYILLGICTALRHIHNLTPVVVHGDIKPGNVLVDAKSLLPKLADFGLARIIQGCIPSLGGSVFYAAPDVFLHQKPSPASDIFSFGRLAYFVVTGEMPMQEHSRHALALFAQQGITPELSWPTPIQQEQQQPQQQQEQEQQQQQQQQPYQEYCKELCSLCCAFDPELRPTARDVHINVWAWPCDQAFNVLEAARLPLSSKIGDPLKKVAGVLMNPFSESQDTEDVRSELFFQSLAAIREKAILGKSPTTTPTTTTPTTPAIPRKCKEMSL
ncbi:unnamed protein product [Polarella glacialis]|nr:unnamed protein product [Polarella glacialis]